MRQLSEKVLEKGKQMMVTSIGLEKAYDNVSEKRQMRASAERLWNGGEVTGDGWSFLLKDEVCVKLGEKLSGCFPITGGVRRGCVISP